MAIKKRSVKPNWAPTEDGRPFFERTHALKVHFPGVIPHDTLYICCPDSEWELRRAYAVLDHPNLFDHMALFGEELDVGDVDDVDWSTIFVRN